MLGCSRVRPQTYFLYDHTRIVDFVNDERINIIVKRLSLALVVFVLGCSRVLAFEYGQLHTAVSK